MFALASKTYTILKLHDYTDALNLFNVTMLVYYNIHHF